MAAGRVDWFRVIVEIERAGVSVAAISARIGAPFETVRGWRNQGAEPRYRTGAALVELWREVTDQPGAAPPDAELGHLSAARAKG